MYFAYQKIHEINWLSITNESYAVHPINLLSSIATGVKGCARMKLGGNLYILISNVFYEYLITNTRALETCFICE